MAIGYYGSHATKLASSSDASNRHDAARCKPPMGSYTITRNTGLFLEIESPSHDCNTVYLLWSRVGGYGSQV